MAVNFKNHTTPRYFELTGDRGESVTYAHGATYKWNLKDIPFTTRRMCNYLAGLVVLVSASFIYSKPEGGADSLDSSDIARALFESCEVQQTMFGTPVSPNHYLGKYMGLFGFVANGMQEVAAQPIPVGSSTALYPVRTYAYFVPLSALLGMKGHHTTQPVVCYDRAQFILRTAASGALNGLQLSSPGNAQNTIRVLAVVNPEPELRLGPGTSIMRYMQNASAAGTMLNIDALGNSTTLEGAEPGAGLAWLAWMGSGLRSFGGPGTVGSLEYISAPFRDIQMIRTLDGFILDWFNACGSGNQPYVDLSPGESEPCGGGHEIGYLFPCGVQHGTASFTDGAQFLPIITPHKYLETSKLQVVQGTQSVSLKSSNSFSGEHVFAALQYHSWTPAKQEEVLRKLIDTGVAREVWGTNDLVPKVKVVNKQPANSLNPAKTRFFATTWEPKEVVTTPPTA